MSPPSQSPLTFYMPPDASTPTNMPNPNAMHPTSSEVNPISYEMHSMAYEMAPALYDMQPAAGHHIFPSYQMFDCSTGSAMNKRKRGKPQRALSSAVVPLAASPALSGSSVQFMDTDPRKESYYYDDQRGGSSSEESHNASHNIMSIQSMLNTSGTITQPPNQDNDGDYSEKSWRRSADRYKRGREGMKATYANGEFVGYGHQSWQETLEKAVRGKQEKEMLDELAAILEMPTKNFPHNTARLCYAKLEALKLLRETCNRGLISEELYAEKQQEFLDSMQF